MGTRRHGQEGAHAPLWKCCKLFCALFCAKRLVDELFMHYFHNLSSASGGFSPRPLPGLHPWAPRWGTSPHTHNLPTPEKNPAGAHALYTTIQVNYLEIWW